MLWFIGLVVFIVILGIIISAIEQERDKKFMEETSRQICKTAEWWYGKK